MTTQQLQRVPQDKLTPFRVALEANARAFESAIPRTVAKYMTPERITKITLAAISRAPLLLKCTPQSVLRSVMDACSLGLEPGGPLGHAYLVPFANNKKDDKGNWSKTYEAQLIVGYRGYISLARRSGEIESVTANVIYSRDKFRVNLAESTIEHEPYMPEMPTPEEAERDQIDPVALMHRGRPVAVYAIAKFVGGGRHADFMTIGDVERIRLRSQAKEKGPWVTDYDEMARKTVVRRAAKYWPLSTELARAMELDNEVDEGAALVVPLRAELRPATAGELPPAEAAEAPAADGEQVDEETGEVSEAHGEHDYGPPPMGEPEVLPATRRVANKIKQATREPGSDG